MLILLCKGVGELDDINKLIEMILSDQKLAASKNFGSKVYTDEPILKTASHMASYLPQKYTEMKKIARSADLLNASQATVFYKQGKFMEDFEDDFDYHGEFIRYYPTYREMSDLQLRGYFSWRTKVRRGTVEKTSISFAFVYVYELLNQIGVKTAREGFDTLMSFWTAYGQLDHTLDRYMKHWMCDYVIYYGLDKSLLDDFSHTAFENSLLVLLSCGAHTNDEVFAALNALSSYNVENSRLFKQYPQDVKDIMCAVFVQMTEYFEKKRVNSFCEKLFGRLWSEPYYMFNYAVFHDTMRDRSCEYVINDINRYSCRNGNWKRIRFCGRAEKSSELGAMLKTVDALMREKYSFSAPIKQGKSTKILKNIACKEIDTYLENKRKNAAPKIEIDVLKLSGIRQAAIKTRDRLIVDEPLQSGDEYTLSEQETQSTVCKDVQSVPAPEPEVCAKDENPMGLSDTQCELLRCLLRGESCAPLIRERGEMLSVVVDGINDKLFDTFADTVIVYDGEQPLLLEDYAQEVKGIVEK